MKTKLLLFLASLAVIVSCGPSQDELMSASIQGISEMAELGTVEYTVKKIVKNEEDDSWYKFGKRKILFSCTAFVKAGINMKGFSADKVAINKEEKSISIVLPKAEVLTFNMPPEEIKQEFNFVTGMRSNFSLEDKQKLLVLGENDIRGDIPNMGILADAEANAKMFFEAMFQRFGYEKIDIKFE